MQWEIEGVHHRGRVVSCKVRDMYAAGIHERISDVDFILVEHFYTHEKELVEVALLKPLEYRKD